jgi:hypothetical protein
MAALFAGVLWRHWAARRSRHVLWWAVGITSFGLGTLAEAVTTEAGWDPSLFRLWYVAGALLGGALLAQGTVHLLLARAAASRLAIGLSSYAAVAVGLFLSAPLEAPPAGTTILDGDVIAWTWVRLLSIPLNLYALVFLAGGAAWSAIRHHRSGEGSDALVWGNTLIAVGAFSPAVGGGLARAGEVEALYIGEVLGLALIWAGYAAIRRSQQPT